jgi:hypothetical protein
MAESLERELRGLLASLGTLDPASEVFAARVAEFERLAGALPADRAGMERLLALNALVRDAVGRERDGVGQQIEQLRSVRESLQQAIQPLETGDSCDVRG